MINKNIPRSAFSHRTWDSGFRPRVGDYLSWPCNKFEDGNWCYQPNKIIGFNGTQILLDGNTAGHVDEWHIGFFIWHRPYTKLTILIKSHD